MLRTAYQERLSAPRCQPKRPLPDRALSPATPSEYVQHSRFKPLLSVAVAGGNHDGSAYLGRRDVDAFDRSTLAMGRTLNLASYPAFANIS
jgi:hypothetical protein